VRLDEAAALLPGSVLTGASEAEVSDVTHDSRRASPGSLFVAIRGFSQDGNAFVEAARKKGALGVVSEGEARAGGPWLQVKDAREALAVLSTAVLARPAERLELVGVTGTNGKTTTTYLIDAILRAAGRTVGLVGTVQYRIGERWVDAVRTTPEASDLQHLFREMAEGGCTHAVLEVSSHSLALKRVHGCAFKVAVFTNLTRDHLDFHGDMDRYFAAKKRLFESLLREDGWAVIGMDDARGEELKAASRGRCLTYALDREADLRAEAVELSLEGTRLRARTPQGLLEVQTPLVGRFNVRNVLAALGAGLALGVSPEEARRGIASLSGVPGRLERVEAGQDFAVIVDYAHTDDALKNLLETLRELQPRRLITVFGCGGDRDRTKRPLMGAVASRLSDLVIVTSDNPRSEPPESILEEILRGIPKTGAARTEALVDRRGAIALALERAGPKDVVVIAGKGHEGYQALRDRTVPFDDRQVARELLGRLLVRGARR
jgi:UDP-N-acetylmuramoyl-L-alanyl-D-glutamate--2,6-diaminopimelate ligase